MTRHAVLFLDRDGTLIEEPADEQVDALEKVRLLPQVVPSLLALRDAGYVFVMISNQDGLGTSSFPRERFEVPQQFLLDLLASQGVRFDAVLICPHTAADACSCRKPATGLIAPYLVDHAIDPERSCVIGDRPSDMELARNLGLQGLRIGAQLDWPGIVSRLTPGPRRATHRRRTRETSLIVSTDLDAEAPVVIATGLGFYDHMLEQLARHGGFALEVRCKGDLHVDEHHTVEDTALALGRCLREALGSKQGIARYGFVLPMDEARAEVLIDLSGRPYLVFDAELRRERVGDLPTELVQHFFRSLADSLGATLHVRVTGSNDHHVIESAFKAVGRALRQAIARTASAAIPSTKGML